MIVIDWETCSECDIKTEGGYNYHVHPSTDILVLAYKIDDGQTLQWTPGRPLPEWIINFEETIKQHKIYAFNFAFEEGIWNNVAMRRYNFPPIKSEHFMDAQALCARYGLPQNLMSAAKVLRVHTQKDTIGKKLITLFCTPPFGRDTNGNIMPHLLHMWKQFLEYNVHDVEATYQVIKALPSDTLSKSEIDIWLMNHEINTRGIPVAVDEAKQILRVTQAFLAEHNERLSDLTGGAVTKVTQIQRIKKWMASIGYPCETLAADELVKWLERDDLPDNLVEVLEIRAGMGLSSLGKYKRIISESNNGRCYFNSRYYGAHTGRITGMGLQMLNLPRAKVKDPEAEIAKFNDLSICYENPVLSARALIRPMVKAEDGKVIMAADYSSIEYILLMWVCKQVAAVKRFDDGFDQYKDLATEMYHVGYDAITKDQRQMGKMGILGCGYGLGANGFVAYADKWNVKLTQPQAREVVNGFRKKYEYVPKFWYSLAEMAHNAVTFMGRDFDTFGVNFKSVRDRNGRRWLQMTLPSGRAMYYFEPNIEMGRYGENVTSWSMNQLTRTWSKKWMTPGKWAENVIQALGRDLLYNGKMTMREAGYDIIFSVYDEVVAEVPEAKADLDDFCKCMCTVPKWAKGLPLRADGYINNRYKKD